MEANTEIQFENGDYELENFVNELHTAPDMTHTLEELNQFDEKFQAFHDRNQHVTDPSRLVTKQYEFVCKGLTVQDLRQIIIGKKRILFQVDRYLRKQICPSVVAANRKKLLSVLQQLEYPLNELWYMGNVRLEKKTKQISKSETGILNHFSLFHVGDHVAWCESFGWLIWHFGIIEKMTPASITVQEYKTMDVNPDWNVPIQTRSSYFGPTVKYDKAYFQGQNVLMLRKYYKQDGTPNEFYNRVNYNN
jgi:hypothetical protein